MTISTLVCHGCGATPAGDPFRCPNAGLGDVDHVLDRHLSGDPPPLARDEDGEGSFVRHRRMLHTYYASGLADDAFLALANQIEDAIEDIDGRRFRVTPFGRNDELSDTTGADVWVKDERNNVAGSHKGRHLMAVAIYLGADPSDTRDLAIASCGNAAVAAAVIARALNRRLRVFVPEEADPSITHRIEDLAADVVRCPRAGGRGDPSYAAMRRAVEDGAVPFTCQGDQNALVIDGGATLGYELSAAAPALDHVIVQVGGGALASSIIRAFDDAVVVGAIQRPPRIHTVQTVGGHPLERAYRLVRETNDLKHAATHRSAYMWPWEPAPQSIATGILDDETYDWWAVVRGMLRTGGQPVVVTEERLRQAVALAGNDDATGAAGIAGLMDLVAAGVVAPGERVALVLTGGFHGIATSGG